MQKGHLLHDLRIWDFHSQCRDSLMIALLTLKAMCSMLRSEGRRARLQQSSVPLKGLKISDLAAVLGRRCVALIMSVS